MASADKALAGAPAEAAAKVTSPRRRWLGDGALARVFRNAGVLLSGKTVAGLFGIGAVAITARALGAEAFGMLVLIHSFTRLIAGLTTFQSWQAIIRYGTACLHDERRRDFQGLIKLSLALDLGGAAAGTVIAVALVLAGSGLVGMSDETARFAALYSLVVLFHIKATPIGLLRLFDRFDVIALQSAMQPGLRLLGAGIAYALDGGLGAFLIVWFVSTVVSRFTLYVLGAIILRQKGMLEGMDSSLRGITRPFAGIWKFVWATNLQASTNALSTNVMPLAVGAVLGPTGAGLYRIARQFADVLVQPATLLRQSIFPEFAKLTVQGKSNKVWRMVLRSGAIAGSIALVAVVVLWVVGDWVILTIVGADYVAAHGVMVLLALAMTVQVFGFALEPVFLAVGRPGILLRVTAIVGIYQFALLLILLDRVGLNGAGLAVLVGALTTVGVLTLAARRWVHHTPEQTSSGGG